MRPLLILALATLFPSASPASAEEGFEPLFNARDLNGWRVVNTAPSTWANPYVRALGKSGN